MANIYTKNINLVLSGGGVRGIAYVGVFDVMEQMGYKALSIAGVSSGALAGSFYGAGFKAAEIMNAMNELDFGKIKMEDIPKRVPAVAEYLQFAEEYAGNPADSLDAFLGMAGTGVRSNTYGAEDDLSRGFLQNLITLCKKGYLFNGDYLEEWVSVELSKKGIRTFADLRGGIKSKNNPKGYKVRMTAVDINRKKILVLPDDIEFYGIDPDRLEVAMAVRMSTSVPFAFKPVEIKVSEAGSTKIYNIVDGGVFDGFPTWLISNSMHIPSVGFKIVGESKNKLLSINTPLNILKAIILATHDTGVPKNKPVPSYIGKINTYNISFLDFDLDEKEKVFLRNAGKSTALFLFSKIENNIFFRLGNRITRIFGLGRTIS